MTNYEYKDGLLPVLVSARVRLNPEQRKEIKAAYYQRKNALVPTGSTGTGGLQVETAYGGSNNLDKAMGMSSLVFSDLINSRDSISLAVILRIQQVLDVEVITKDKLMEACSSYCEYVFLKAENE